MVGGRTGDVTTAVQPGRSGDGPGAAPQACQCRILRGPGTASSCSRVLDRSGLPASGTSGLGRPGASQWARSTRSAQSIQTWSKSARAREPVIWTRTARASHGYSLDPWTPPEARHVDTA